MRYNKSFKGGAEPAQEIDIMAMANGMHEAFRQATFILDSLPFCAMLWNKNIKVFQCNEAAVKHFGMKNKREFVEKFNELSPEFQPDGRQSDEAAIQCVRKAFIEGSCVTDWMYRLPDGTPAPFELTFVRSVYGEGIIVAAYARNLSDQRKMALKISRLRKNLEAETKRAWDVRSALDEFISDANEKLHASASMVISLSEELLNNEKTSGEIRGGIIGIKGAGEAMLTKLAEMRKLSVDRNAELK